MRVERRDRATRWRLLDGPRCDLAVYSGRHALISSWIGREHGFNLLNGQTGFFQARLHLRPLWVVRARAPVPLGGAKGRLDFFALLSNILAREELNDSRVTV